MYDFDPLEAQPGFESSTKFANWKKLGAGTWSRTTVARIMRSGSAAAQLTGNLSSGARMYNDSFYVQVPDTGTQYVTVVAWVRRNGSVTIHSNINAAEEGAEIPESGLLQTPLIINSTTYIRMEHTFLAKKGAKYFPVLYVSSPSTSSATFIVDDVFIYTSGLSSLDTRAPANAFGFKVQVVEDTVQFSFTSRLDDELPTLKNIIVRYDNIVNQNNSTPVNIGAQTFLSTNAQIGPTTIANSGKVVYEGPLIQSFSDVPESDRTTYVVYTVDKAHNYSVPSTGQTMPRVMILKNGATGQSITNNFTMAAFWLCATCTYTIAGAATMNMSDNGVPGGSTVYGTMWQNTGNINQRANPPSTIVYKSGSKHINNRNTVRNPDGNYMPFATWEPGSVALVTGNKPTGIGNTGQVFHDFIWDTEHLGVDFQFDRGFGVNGDFIIKNTYDTARKINRILLMPDTVMVVGGNFIIEDTAKARIYFPGPTKDSLPFGVGNTVKFIGAGDQEFVNNELTYDLFSLDISKPSGRFNLKQDLQLRGSLNVDSGFFDNKDFKLIMQGAKADAALPQQITGALPISFQEVIINNTNNATTQATQQQMVGGNLVTHVFTIPDSNYVVTHNNFTVREKLRMVSGKLIAGSKTLTIRQGIDYTTPPAPVGMGGTNNFFGGRFTGNIRLTGTENQKMLWGFSDNELDTLRVQYSHGTEQRTATLNGMGSVYIKNLLVEDQAPDIGSKLVNSMDVHEAFLWALDSLGVAPASIVNNHRNEAEVTNLPVLPVEGQEGDRPANEGNGFGFGIGGNMRVDGTWQFSTPHQDLGRVYFNGTKRHFLWGNAPKVNWHHMELDNPEGLSVHAHTDLHRRLLFTRGHIHTNAAHHFTMLQQGVTYNADQDRFINGPMHRLTDATVYMTDLINPVGKIGGKHPYRPMIIRTYQAQDVQRFSIEYFPQQFASYSLMGAYLYGINKEEYWQVNKVSEGSVQARLCFKYLQPYDNNWSPILPNEVHNVVISQGKGSSPEQTNWYVAGELQEDFTIASEAPYTWKTSWNSNGTDLWTIPMRTFSPFTFGFIGPNILPIRLLDFRALVHMGRHVKIDWEIALVGKASSFVLEYSSNGADFSKLAALSIQAGKGTYMHQNPGGGMHYYRLQWTGQDGKVEYSNIKNAFLPGTLTHTQPIVTPNPFYNQLMVELSSAVAQLATFELMNFQGKVIYSSKRLIKAGLNSLRLQDFQGLPPGLYVFQVATLDGTRFSGKFLKK